MSDELLTMSQTTPAAVATRALEDLRTGQVTTAVLRTITRTATAVARTGQFTTPAGSRHWSSHDVDDLVSDFFTVRGRVEALATRAGEGPDAVARFRAAVQTSLRRAIIDRYRAGPRGVLDRRIQRRVSQRDDVVTVPPAHWALNHQKHLAHWGGDDNDLVAAASGVQIEAPPAWAEDSERQAPATTTESIDLACSAVLRAAGCPVSQTTVRRIVVGRVIPFDPNEVRPPDEREVSGEHSSLGPELDGAARVAAEAFWVSLDDGERSLLLAIRTPARQLADAGFLGLKKSAIDSRQRALELRLQEFVAGTPEARAAFNHLLDLHHEWEAGQIKGVAP